MKNNMSKARYTMNNNLKTFENGFEDMLFEAYMNLKTVPLLDLVDKKVRENTIDISKE